MSFQSEQYLTDFYFDDMLKEVDESAILQAWENIVRCMNIPNQVIEMHKRVIDTTVFLSIMKTQQWRLKMQKLITGMGSHSLALNS